MALLILISFFVFSGHSKSQNPCSSVEHGVPVFEGRSRLIGCKLEKVEPNSFYEKLGLKVGDVVRPSKEDSVFNLKENGIVENGNDNTPIEPQEATDPYQKAKTR